MSQQTKNLERGINEGKVRRVRNKTPDLKKAVKIAKGSPEVMVKMTGCTKSLGHMHNHLDYLSRNGKIELEDDRGNIYKDKDAGKEIAKEWKDEHEIKRNTKREQSASRLSTTIVFSMPFGTPPEAVKDAVRELAKQEFQGKYNYVMALHKDTDSPHAHLCICNKGINGQKNLHFTREEMDALRGKFAEKMQEQGIDAEATPRAMRGVVKKSERIAAVKARERLQDKGERLNKDKKLVQEVVAERRGLKAKPVEPWNANIQKQQTEIRQAWANIHEELKAQGKKEDAEAVKKFIESMPKIETRKQELFRRFDEAMKDKDRQKQPQELTKPLAKEADKEPPRGGDIEL